KNVVMGIVDTPQAADLTVRRLVALGFSPGDVSVLYPDRHGDRDVGFEARTKAPEGALLGAGLGAVPGALGGLAAGLLGVVPELAALGPYGPVLLALACAALAALVLGAGGALVGASVPEIEARCYEGKTRVGSILVAAHASSRAR